MGKLTVYNFMTINGFFKGPAEDISWAKKGSAEENAFAAENLKSGNILLFGRKTYEMMAAYWPTPTAAKNDPVIAGGMNKSEKIVFSTTLKKAEWTNTRVVKENLGEEIKKLKKESGQNITLLGSGSIVNQLSEKGLIDEYQIMMHPVFIGNGTSIVRDISHNLELKLISSRVFKNGSVFLCYQPV